jgi:hypothetical protein
MHVLVSRSFYGSPHKIIAGGQKLQLLIPRQFVREDRFENSLNQTISRRVAELLSRKEGRFRFSLGRAVRTVLIAQCDHYRIKTLSKPYHYRINTRSKPPDFCHNEPTLRARFTDNSAASTDQNTQVLCARKKILTAPSP